ncbi:MAG: hypothetical protein ACLPV4_24910 [Solirubrobacteraceae bacterium]
MTIHEASRTLLKSPPELWTECSDASSLSRHLDQFGEIKITRLEPETAVAWEGENVSGTVKLEPSGWGTRVILTAEEIDPVIEAEPEADAEPQPASAPEPAVIELPVVSAPPPVPEPAAAAPAEPEPAAKPEPPSEPELAADPSSGFQPDLGSKTGFFARLFGGKRKFAWPQVEPVITAETRVGEVAPEPVVRAKPEPTAEPAPEAREPAPEPDEPAPERAEPAPEPAGPAPEPAEPAPEPAGPGPGATIRALTEALESLGMAHLRPFSRS